MRIVYVGDNRNRGNFGCRATSTALSQIISSKHEIVGTIYGKYTNVDTGELFFSRCYPAWMYKFVGKFKYWKYMKTVWYIFHRMLKRGKYYFSKYDFINYDLDKSIERLIKCLPANPHMKEFDLRQYDFDALVVNGEGSFIFATPPWRECLTEAMLMHWALKMGKKVYFMNGMFSNDPYSDKNEKTLDVVRPIMEKAQLVAVREHKSYEYAKREFPNANIKCFPDALFSWYDYINDSFVVPDLKYVAGMSGAFNDSFNGLDFTSPYICISGSSSVGLASKDEEHIINVYCNLVSAVKEAFKCNCYLVEVCEGDSFLREVSKRTHTPFIPIDTPILSAGKILANSTLYISGRYHPSILASLGGTPCVFLGSNSHKTRSVQELLEYDNIIEYPVLPNKKDIKDIIDDGKRKIESGDSLRKKIQKRTKYLCKETKKQGEEVI